MTMTDQQLIKNVKKDMKRTSNMRDHLRRYMLLGKEHPVLKDVGKYAELYDAEYRWHANSLVMLLAIDKKTPTAELIRRRTDIARRILEITEELVEVGEFSEQKYLKDCKFYNDDLKNLL
jgi:hypothetical protein